MTDTIQGAIYRRMLNGSVGDLVGTRLFADDFAQHDTAMPFVVFEVDRTESDADLSGTIDWAVADLTVVCFDDDSHDCQLMTLNVRRDLQDWQDDGENPIIEWSLYQDTINGVVEATRSDKLRYRKEVSFQVRYRDVTIDDL